MKYVGPARLDHISPVQTDHFQVKSESKQDGTIEWVTLEFAANRVAGYMNLDLDETTEELREGAIGETISFIYVIPEARERLLEAVAQDRIARPAQYREPYRAPKEDQ